MAMTVGISRITLIIPEGMSLKSKRKVVKSLVERCRNRFNASVAEVDDHDLYQKTTLAIAVVGKDGRTVNTILDKITEYVDSLKLAEIIDQEIELIHY
ncbi:MAG: DUF503 domain-containing protein [Thermodesulforhabdaceae bacterium]